MSTPAELVHQVRSLGARLWVDGERLELDAPQDFPDEMIDRLRENKPAVLVYLRQGAATDGPGAFKPWALAVWRRDSIPDWRRILQDSITQGDKGREEYARWMLREVLLDPEYKEPPP